MSPGPTLSSPSKCTRLNFYLQVGFLSRHAHQLDSWKPYIYTSDKEPGYRPIPANKAREGMAYLTHIIEHYDYLADVTAFMHASATQWHNDVGDMASSSLLQKLSLDAVNKAGYANLRCEHRPGCPVAVRPFDPAMESNHNVVYRNFTSIYMDMFSVPREQVPTEIGGVCCGQFVLTRDRIRERPRDDYVRIRDWALATDMDNFAAGSVFEMLWHIIFLEQPVSIQMSGLTGVLTAPYILPALQYVSAPASPCKSSYSATYWQADR
ncbi:similar to An14g03060 [Aspergillus luchuensis]|uniref:Similar to An14g03060 n=1 Tax=Aspergillus kawachii TaxID=1069201 RepID=A0A146FGS4_ASPKA|nr:similar to An14g03060 [Aspergillus luchuensis]